MLEGGLSSAMLTESRHEQAIKYRVINGTILPCASKSFERFAPLAFGVKPVITKSPLSHYNYALRHGVSKLRTPSPELRGSFTLQQLLACRSCRQSLRRLKHVHRVGLVSLERCTRKMPHPRNWEIVIMRKSTSSTQRHQQGKTARRPSQKHGLHRVALPSYFSGPGCLHPGLSCVSGRCTSPAFSETPTWRHTLRKITECLLPFAESCYLHSTDKGTPGGLKSRQHFGRMS